MFSKKALILLLISIHCLIDVALTGKIGDKLKAKAEANKKSKSNNKPEDPKVSKVPKLTPDQIEFSKKFFKNLNDDQKKAMDGVPLNYSHLSSKELKKVKGDKLEVTTIEIEDEEEDKPLKASQEDSDDEEKEDKVLKSPQSQPAPGGIGTYKSVPSGGTVFMDGITSNFVPIGDPYSGLPDGIIGLAKWCIEVFIKGAILIIYTTIRYPHKIFLKMVIITGAIAWVPTTILWCLNPVSIARIVGKSKIVNNNFDELADLQYKLKVRLANVIDKVYNLKEIQKLTCCMYQDWRDSSVRVVDDSVKEFLMHWFHSFVKLITIVYCGDYSDGTDQCASVEFDESEPIRVIPRSHVTLWIEMFVKFF